MLFPPDVKWVVPDHPADAVSLAKILFYDSMRN
jgi:hypothetical protein